MDKRIVTFPIMGKKNSEVIKEFLESLDIKVILPPPITDKTIKLGVRHSASMMCIPFKITLGNYIEALDKGANTLLAYDSRGVCRFRQYTKAHVYILERLGYKFEMHVFNSTNVISKLKELSGKSSLKIFKEFNKHYKKIQKNDEYIWSKDKINIGIIGEVYVSSDEKVNYDIENKIKKFGGNPINTATFSGFIKEKLGILRLQNIFKKNEMKKYKKEAKTYFNGKLGGHSFENIYNLLYLKDKKIDGIIHLMPLSCFTEETEITVNNFTSKMIKDIKIGDEVLTHKGRFRKVETIMEKIYNGKILEINCRGLTKINTTKEHPILSLKRKDIVCNGRKRPFLCRPKNTTYYCKKWNHNCKLKRKEINFTPIFRKSDELEKGDFIAIPKPKNILSKKYYKSLMINPKKPKYKDVKEFPYTPDLLRVLGYWLAEGSINYDSSKTRDRKYLSGLTFTFNSRETNFTKEIKKTIEKNFDAYVTTYTNKNRPNTIDLKITNRSLAYIFEKLCGKYCDKKIIHNDIMNLEPSLQLELVKGFFRGDGHYENNSKTTRYRATTTSFKLANQLFWILIRNNIKATIRKHKKRKNRKDAYIINISSIDCLRRLKEDNIKLPERKFTTPHFLETKDYFFLPIREIKKKNFKGRVYNLEVKEDNSYIANFLTVHNCCPESMIECYIDGICKDNNIPLLRIPIDENSAEKNLETRLETYCELLKMRKGK